MIDIVQLTEMFGELAHEQSAVQSWTGDPHGHRWTKTEAELLLNAWEADKGRIRGAA